MTATPARHGPPGATLTAGPVTGFCLAWEGQVHGQFYRPQPGRARFQASGPMRYTMNAARFPARWILPGQTEGVEV